MTTSIDLQLAREFATAILIGALVGVEREKQKREDEGGLGGIRTFVLIALTGAMAAFLAEQLRAPAVFVAGAVVAGAVIVAGYLVGVLRQHGRPGLTTEFAAVAVWFLGGLCVLGHSALAVALGIATSALLAFKQPIHALVDKLGMDDLYAGLKLLLATFIILPVLPNQTVDPWGALNPYKLWLLVILIAAMSLVGYVATRWLGPGRGTVVTGVTGGLVSSTAVTLALARRSRDADAGRESPGMLATGILVAWLVMVARILALLFVANAALARRLILPMAALGLATSGAALGCYLAARRQAATPATSVAVVPLRNPFSLTSAMRFAALFAVVLLLVRLAERHLPGAAQYLVAALAGTTDVDAISLSMADYARSGGLMEHAARAVIVACVSNTVVKTSLVAALAAPGLRRKILLAGAVVTLAGVPAWFLV